MVHSSMPPTLLRFGILVSIHITIAISGFAILGNAQELPFRSDTLDFNREVKIFFSDETVMRGVVKYLVADQLIMDSGREIPVAQVKRIRVYRHIVGKTILVSGMIGLCAGILYSIGSKHNTGFSDDVATGFLFAIPTAAVGAVVSPLLMPFFKYSFRIDGQASKAQKMVKRLGKGNGSQW